ncbi:5343_t:CDS:2 [Paraglomus brasilianum]|uniref:5343_t:CDS:1 n=1 Tax=Paraglomus brasilianum TaxID=144538 RepID=A0A9N9BF09_9GLOM|nr:5343_t:CDS:2 [Paraglomus brasilianum]
MGLASYLYHGYEEHNETISYSTINARRNVSLKFMLTGELVIL